MRTSTFKCPKCRQETLVKKMVHNSDKDYATITADVKCNNCEAEYELFGEVNIV